MSTLSDEEKEAIQDGLADVITELAMREPFLGGIFKSKVYKYVFACGWLMEISLSNTGFSLEENESNPLRNLLVSFRRGDDFSKMKKYVDSKRDPAKSGSDTYIFPGTAEYKDFIATPLSLPVAIEIPD